jgi:hypothetical protein
MFWTMLALLGAAAQPPAAAAETPFDWMVGDWSCFGSQRPAAGPIAFDEYWIADRRGGLVGVGRVRQGATRSIEHMRVGAHGTGETAFFGSPQGAPPVAFRLVRSGPQEAVFENAGHDYPQRIRYRRVGETLIATVSKIDGTDAQSWRYVRAAALTGETYCDVPPVD